MLILTRKTGQKIIINKGEIEITVLYSRCNHARLGIKAPKDIDIDREEIFIRKQEEKKEGILKRIMSIRGDALGGNNA